ncbi:MAG: L-threonylcarbamoyladenylate synthase [Defluviitaleaceae bacterium]|nr:L-threonylcarbamoyladenylate synthase [Defluviitaleaceae bacterium]MCL2240206.1 L-threonylcarbamoyladenylate synthase [Defluviitaleaceae bacterium]
MRLVKADENGIQQAAGVIRNGGCVAMPTETVYGLGADAFNPEAVRAVYAAKDRPGDNPLILHIADKVQLTDIAADVPDYAWKLADAFWPGPLTLVVRKKAGLPPYVGGHPERETDTAGVRMPSHPVALAVIRASGCIVAAPSANKAGTPSPTCAAHVEDDYRDSALAPDMLLDGGPVEVGVESTVVDVTGDAPVILRPGAVTAEMAGEVLGQEISGSVPSGSVPRAPGMKYRHYAPKATMTLLSGPPKAVASYITTQIVSDIDAHIGVLASPGVQNYINSNWNLMSVQGDSVYTPMVSVLTLGDGGDLPAIAKNLYANLRKFDELGVDIILAEALPETGLGAAIMDRMNKAAQGRRIRLGVDA